MKRHEGKVIKQALEDNKVNIQSLANRLNVGRTTLYSKFKDVKFDEKLLEKILDELQWNKKMLFEQIPEQSEHSIDTNNEFDQNLNHIQLTKWIIETKNQVIANQSDIIRMQSELNNFKNEVRFSLDNAEKTNKEIFQNQNTMMDFLMVNFARIRKIPVDELQKEADMFLSVHKH